MVFAELVLGLLDFDVESVAEDEANGEEYVGKDHHLDVLRDLDCASADNVVSPLVDEPVEHVEHEKADDGGHLVDVECVPEDDAQQQEVKHLLLALLKDVLNFDDADVAEEQRNHHVAQLHHEDSEEVEDDQHVQLVLAESDHHREHGVVVLVGLVDDPYWQEQTRHHVRDPDRMLQHISKIK